MKKKFAWPVIGHKNITEYLQRSIVSERLVHAYLFVGPKAVGKSTVASYFAQSLLCRSANSDKDSFPCGKCEHCRQFNNNVHPDVIKIIREEEDKNVTIDQVREVIAKLSLKSFIAKYKIAIIEEADYLSEEAANALLKTLEEPSGQTVVILLAQDINLLPLTIRSRCQLIRFSPVKKEILIDYLENHSNLDKTTIFTMSRLSQGLPGMIDKWINNKHDWEDYVISVRNKIRQLERPLYENLKASREIFPLNLVFNKRLEILEQELNQWTYILRDILLVKNGNDAQVTHYFLINDLSRIAHGINFNKLKRAIDWLVKMRDSLQFNPNPQLTMESFYLYINN